MCPMSATEMQTNDNNVVIHNDPLNHMEISGLGKESLNKEYIQGNH